MVFVVKNLIPETPRMNIIDCTIAIILSCALKNPFKKIGKSDVSDRVMLKATVVTNTKSLPNP